MLSKDFMNNEIGKHYWGLVYDLNFLIGKFGFLESQAEIEKCGQIIDKFYFESERKIISKVDKFIDRCVDYLKLNEEVDGFLNKEFCVECTDNCCYLRNIGFFTFGDLLRLKSLCHNYPDIKNLEKKLNEKCCFLYEGCGFNHDFRPLMCVISICTDWGIVEPYYIFEDENELKRYKKNGNEAYISQKKASKIILETIYGEKLK